MNELLMEISKRLGIEIGRNIQEGESAFSKRDYDAALVKYENGLQILDNSYQNILGIFVYLIKIAGVFSVQQNYRYAALCNNAALALWDKYQASEQSPLGSHTLFSTIPKIDNKYQKNIIDCLVNVVGLFLIDNGIKNIESESIASAIENQRAELITIRDYVTQSIKSSKMGAEIAAALTQKFKIFFSKIIDLCVSLLGPAPCGWIAVGFGSMARDEMCPYSDDDYGFIIEDKKDITINNLNRKYFLRLARLVEIFVINLGETEFPILSKKYKKLYEKFSGKLRNLRHIAVRNESPTPSGFSIDPAGLNPLGREGIYELICTPEELVKLNQNNLLMEEHEHLALSLKTTCFITGTMSTLLTHYEHALKQYLDSKDKNGFSHRRVLALELLKPMLVKFKPPLDRQKSDERFFHVKKELYRTINMVFECIAIDQNMEQKSTALRILEAHKRGLLQDNAKKHLLDTLNTILLLRIRIQLFYRDEIEQAHHPLYNLQNILTTEEKLQIYHLNSMEIGDIHRCYRTLVPLYHAIKAFYESKGDLTKLSKSNCITSDLHQAAAVNVQDHEYDAALLTFQQALAIDPDNIKSLIDYGKFLCDLQKHREAMQIYDHAIQLIKERHLEKSSLGLLVNVCTAAAAIVVGNIRYANQLLVEVLNHPNILAPENARNYIHALRIKAGIYNENKDLPNALATLMTALNFADQNEHTSEQRNVGVVSDEEGNVQQLKIVSQYKNRGLDVRLLHGDLCYKIAVIYLKQKNFSESIKYMLRALNEYSYELYASTEDLGEEILDICLNLALAYELNKDFNNAKKYYDFILAEHLDLKQDGRENSLSLCAVTYLSFMLRNSYELETAFVLFNNYLKFVPLAIDPPPIEKFFEFNSADTITENNDIETERLRNKNLKHIAESLLLISCCRDFLSNPTKDEENKLKLLNFVFRLFNILLACKNSYSIKEVRVEFVNLIGYCRSKIFSLFKETHPLYPEISKLVLENISSALKLQNVFQPIDRALLLNCQSDIFLITQQFDLIKQNCQEALDILNSQEDSQNYINPEILYNLKMALEDKLANCDTTNSSEKSTYGCKLM